MGKDADGGRGRGSIVFTSSVRAAGSCSWSLLAAGSCSQYCTSFVEFSCSRPIRWFAQLSGDIDKCAAPDLRAGALIGL